MNEKGLYVYCVAGGKAPASLGTVGIENSRVYALSYKNVCAVVHECEAKPYYSKDEKTAVEWVRKHNEVISRAAEVFGAVLPMTFNMIVKRDGSRSPEKSALEWLKNEHGSFSKKLGRLRGRQEFGVQIFWDSEALRKRVCSGSREIGKLRNALKNETKGKAYFVGQKIEGLLKAEIEHEANKHFKIFYEQIRKHADEIKIDKVKKAKGAQMFANLSCLVKKGSAQKLGAELEKIGKMEGFSVRFTGPWPPYSFAQE